MATYDSAGQLTGDSAGTVYSYNARGDCTAAGATTYGYDSADRLISATGTTGTTRYTYNGDGLRTGKTNAVTNAGHVWDTVTESVGLLLGDGAAWYIYGPSGEPVEQIGADGTASYLHQDQLGSTRMVAGAAGAVLATYTYDAYGSILNNTGSSVTNLLYAGQYRDAETGFYYLRARYYDPVTGQFLTPNPVDPLTLAPYAYTHDDPINATDLSGLCSWYDVVCGVEAGAKWAWHHPAEVGIILGGVALAATGVGLFAEGGLAVAAGVVGVAAGAGATALDTGPCLNGDKAACGGMIMGGVGLLFEGGALALEFAPLTEAFGGEEATNTLGDRP